ELVLNLQNVGIKLDPFAILLGAKGFVSGPRCGNSRVHPLQERFEIVVAELELGLSLVLVSQITHAKAGSPGQIQRFRVKLLQAMWRVAQKNTGNGRRCAEKIHQEPGISSEVANQGEVALAPQLLQRHALNSNEIP